MLRQLNRKKLAKTLAGLERDLAIEARQKREMLAKYGFVIEKQRRLISAQREAIFRKKRRCDFFKSQCPLAYKALLMRLPAKEIEQLERTVTLRAIMPAGRFI